MKKDKGPYGRGGRLWDGESEWPIFQIIGTIVGLFAGIYAGQYAGTLGLAVCMISLTLLGAWIGKQIDLKREEND